MDVKEIEVDCPCCATRLTVDVLTRTVLRSTPRERIDATGKARVDPDRWGVATGRVSGRGGEAQDKFDQALSYEKGKEAHLDELYDAARKKLGRRGGDEDA